MGDDSKLVPDPSKILGPMEEAILPLPPEDAKARMGALNAIVMFEKVLTQSDTSGSGRLVIPRAVAEAHFPHLDDPSGVRLPLVDVFGKIKHFKYRFWINNSSRMYIIEGTQALQKMFKLNVGDVLMFAKDTSNTIFVGGRKGTRSDVFRKPPTRKKKDAADGSEKKSRKDGGAKEKKSRPKPVSVSYTPQMKTLTKEEQEIANSYTYWNAISYPPRNDGVFRAVPATCLRQPDQVSIQFGMWCVTVTLAGEQFQGFFDSKEAAHAAYTAALQTIL